MEIILDTSFILSCLKEKIDFLDAENFGKLVLATQVLEELENLTEKDKAKEREIARLALKIIEKNKDKFKIIELERKYVDSGILKYVQGNTEVIVATIDKELKRKLKGIARILTIRARKKLSLE